MPARRPGTLGRPRSLLRLPSLLALLGAGTLMGPAPLSGQVPTEASEASRLSVFLDCEGRECMVASTFFRNVQSVANGSGMTPMYPQWATRIWFSGSASTSGKLSIRSSSQTSSMTFCLSGRMG